MMRKISTLILLSFLALGTAVAQSGSLNKFILQIGGHNQNSAYGSLLDLKEEKVYKVDEGSERQGDIDLLYAWGKSTSANLMTPSSNGLTQFGALYRDKIDGEWETKNGGLLVVLKDTRKNKKLYRNLKTGDDIQKLYTETAKTIKDKPDYALTKYGPSRRLVDLQVGDLVLFRSIGRKFYAAGTILHIEEGYRGEIEIEFKVSQ